MSHRIEGWCIIDSQTGERILKVYETRGGAKTSFNNSCYARLCLGHVEKFDEQIRYILNPLVLIEGEDDSTK